MCKHSKEDLQPPIVREGKVNRRSLMKLAGISTFGLLGAQTTKPVVAATTADPLTPKKSLCGWDPASDSGPMVRDIPDGISSAELARHEKYILEAIKLSQQAEQHCNHPFGALLVLPPAEGEAEDNYKIILKGENRVYTDSDSTQHAETRLVSDANKSDHITDDMMSRATLYTSAEPCAMCCGAIFWSGIRSVVYAAPHDSFGASSFPVPCREVFKFATLGQAVTVVGPVLASESMPVVGGYFRERWASVKDACRISNKL